MRRKYEQTFLSVLLFFSIATFIYYPIFSWTFWKDDWWFLYGSYTYNQNFLTNILQPGTIAQFLLFRPFFDIWPLPYLAVGFVSKLLFAYVCGLLSSVLISKRSRTSATFLALVLPIGIDSVGWPSAHVTIFSSILLMYGLALILRRNAQGYGYIALCGACLLDPGRTIFLIFYILIFLYHRKILSRITFLSLLVTSVGILVLVLFRMREYIQNFQVIHYLLARLNHLSYQEDIHVLKYIQNFFSSVFNLLFGSIYPIPHYLSTGIPNTITSFLGIITICMLILFALQQYRKNKDSIPIFSVGWLIISYITPWLFEPRLTLSVYHRYMVIPGIGVLLLLSWIGDRIQNNHTRRLLLVTLLFIAGAISIHFISTQSPFRNALRTKELYELLLSEEKKYQAPMLFYITGNDQIIPASLSFSENLPLSVLTYRKDNSHLPGVAILPEHVTKYSCEMKQNTYTLVTIEMNKGLPIKTMQAESLPAGNCK